MTSSLQLLVRPHLWVRHAPIAAASQQRSDFIMVAQKRNEQFPTPDLKDEPEIAVATTLEKLGRQFTDSGVAVYMRLPESLDEIAERQ